MTVAALTLAGVAGCVVGYVVGAISADQQTHAIGFALAAFLAALVLA
ncbi:hypothetical protein [Dankookia rubra]|nr:hypothetical protein [Dankookia rubra]